MCTRDRHATLRRTRSRQCARLCASGRDGAHFLAGRNREHAKEVVFPPRHHHRPLVRAPCAVQPPPPRPSLSHPPSVPPSVPSSIHPSPPADANNDDVKQGNGSCAGGETGGRNMSMTWPSAAILTCRHTPQRSSHAHPAPTHCTATLTTSPAARSSSSGPSSAPSSALPSADRAHRQPRQPRPRATADHAGRAAPLPHGCPDMLCQDAGPRQATHQRRVLTPVKDSDRHISTFLSFPPVARNLPEGENRTVHTSSLPPPPLRLSGARAARARRHAGESDAQDGTARGRRRGWASRVGRPGLRLQAWTAKA